jgi:ribosomal protein S18 acetylase RimI-like enzyme
MENIIFVDNLDNIAPQKLNGFFVGWQKPLSTAEHIKLLEGSSHFVLAVDTDCDEVVGFITALTDGINCAFIPLLEVLPEYQNRGIGTQLLQLILQKLDSITCVDLTCDVEMQAFYEKFGMLKSNGMVLRKYL